MIEPTYVEFQLDGQYFNTGLPPRTADGTVSYALGLWGRCVLPRDAETALREIGLSDGECLGFIASVFDDGLLEQRQQLRSTNLLMPGPAIYWVTDTDDRVWMHTLLSVVIPDTVPLKAVCDFFHNRSRFPARLVDQELERIQQARAAAQVFGEQAA